jgi:hypothetical protein
MIRVAAQAGRKFELLQGITKSCDCLRAEHVLAHGDIDTAAAEESPMVENIAADSESSKS